MIGEICGVRFDRSTFEGSMRSFSLVAHFEHGNVNRFSEILDPDLNEQMKFTTLNCQTERFGKCSRT